MMMNLFLWGFLFTVTTGIFTYSTLLTSAARTFEGLDVSLAQSAVVALEEAAGVTGGPYFDEMLFTERVNAYFLQGLASYFEADDWTVAIQYRAYRVLGSDGQGRYPSEAQVNFNCSIVDLFQYRNQRTFAILPGERHVA